MDNCQALVKLLCDTFGGWLVGSRAGTWDNPKDNGKDWDVILPALSSWSSVRALTAELKWETNSLGGYKFILPDGTVDVWMSDLGTFLMALPTKFRGGPYKVEKPNQCVLTCDFLLPSNTKQS